jgi:hypothetical protein
LPVAQQEAVIGSKDKATSLVIAHLAGVSQPTVSRALRGRPMVNEAKKPKRGGGTVQPIVPGLEGGTNWFPPAYDPDLGLFFVSVNQWGMGLTSWEKGKLQYKPGDLYMGVDYQMYRMGQTIGHLRAIDVANRKIVWDVPSSLPLFAGIVVTKSGVVFTGDQRGRVRHGCEGVSRRVLAFFWRFRGAPGAPLYAVLRSPARGTSCTSRCVRIARRRAATRAPGGRLRNGCAGAVNAKAVPLRADTGIRP